ncbi:MAG: hypothetical protein ACPLPU_08395, partial [Thermodesulfovibrio yellowstonii]
MHHELKFIKEEVEKRALNETDKEIIEKSILDGIETAWDRLYKQQPQCGFGLLGVCCNRCVLGPCRIDPFGGEPQRGVCGATSDLIVARNLLDTLATGAAAHSDHGRVIVSTNQNPFFTGVN